MDGVYNFLLAMCVEAAHLNGGCIPEGGVASAFVQHYLQEVY